MWKKILKRSDWLKVRRICKRCGKEFFVWPSTVKIGHGKYCSKECADLSNTGRKNKPDWKRGKIKCVCKQCGKEFNVVPSRIKIGGGKYCSLKCRGEAKRGEKSPFWKGGEIIHYCKQCGREFAVDSWADKTGNGKYCSVECRGKARRNRTICICEVCGTEFEIKTSRVERGNGRYCSKVCADIAQTTSIKTICQTCGKEFEVAPSLIKKGHGKYCSRECRAVEISGDKNSSWRGGTSFLPYCPKFNKRRKKAVRDFFNNMCLGCGKLASENVVGGRGVINLPVHHVDHDKEQGCNGKPFNLVPLCYDCHGDEFNDREGYQKYINKTLEEGFKWGIWNREEYIEKVMYPED